MYMAIYLVYLAGAVCRCVWAQKNRKKKISFKLLAGIFFARLAVRLFFARQNRYFGYDMGCFKYWGLMTHDAGLKNIYGGAFFIDYPPMYLYVLYVTEGLRRILGIAYDSVAAAFLIKLWPIAMDMASGRLIYALAKKHRGRAVACRLAAGYLFCPRVIYTSSVWGQVDSFFILLLLLALCFITENKTLPAAVCYGIAVLAKPQALLFGAVFLLYIIEKKSVKELFKALRAGLGTVWALSLPFSKGISPLWLVDLYTDTMGSYRYYTVNGYNLYGLLGKNWQDLTGAAGLINSLVIAALLAVCRLCYFKLDKKERNYSTAFISIVAVFTLCTMMHERYLLPAVLLGFAWAAVSEKIYPLCFALLAGGVCFFNTALSMDSFDAAVPRWKIGLISRRCLTLCRAGLRAYIRPAVRERSVSLPRYAGIGALTAAYAFLAFYRLGSFTAPETYYQPEGAGRRFTVTFDSPRIVKNIYTFCGMGDEKLSGQVTIGSDFEVLGLRRDGEWHSLRETGHDYVFTWKKQETSFFTDCVRVEAKSGARVLNEIIFTDENGEIITGKITGSSGGTALYPAENALNESYCLPASFESCYYSSYFDEIYHARSAYEILNGYSVYESTHPPLGKEIMSLGIALFGMNPFGWRCMGALAGVIMIPVIYLLALCLLKSRRAALFASAVLAADFMHYTQTRLATVDSFVVLFTLLMYLFMAKYANEADVRRERLWLALSGVSMGCCVAVKWNGAYGAVGLAIFFFITLYRKCRKDGRLWKKRFFSTVGFCFLAFVAVPLLIYCASFVPVIHTEGSFIEALWNYQLSMYSYHSTLVSEHFFSSPWYSWIVCYKPMWYSVSREGGLVSSISAFGNPLVWLCFPLRIALCAMRGAKGDAPAQTAVIGYLSCLLPWALVSRQAYIYHYFPATIFGILAIALAAQRRTEDFTDKKKTAGRLCYLGLCFAAMAIFFPVLSGLAAPREYIDGLELLGSWYFN